MKIMNIDTVYGKGSPFTNDLVEIRFHLKTLSNVIARNFISENCQKIKQLGSATQA